MREHVKVNAKSFINGSCRGWATSMSKVGEHLTSDKCLWYTQWRCIEDMYIIAAQILEERDELI